MTKAELPGKLVFMNSVAGDLFKNTIFVFV